MGKFHFWDMVSYSKEVLQRPFESTEAYKDEGGLSEAVKYVSVATLIKTIVPVLMIFLGAKALRSSSYGMGLEGIIYIVLIFGGLAYLASIIFEPIKMLAFSYIFYRISKWQGSKVTFEQAAYSFSLLWAPMILLEGIWSIILSYAVPRVDASFLMHNLQMINLILPLIKILFLYLYVIRIGKALTKLPKHKLALSVIFAIATPILLTKAISYLMTSGITDWIGQ